MREMLRGGVGAAPPAMQGLFPRSCNRLLFRASSAQGAAGELGARKMKQSEINSACWMEPVRALEKQRKL